MLLRKDGEEICYTDRTHEALGALLGAVLRLGEVLVFLANNAATVRPGAARFSAERLATPF